MKNNQKGITLIALVVTIIVLLILAGVSIAMLTGQNGILNRASEASINSKIGDAEDLISLNVSDKITDYFHRTYVETSETADATDTLAKAIADGIAAAKTSVADGVTVETTITAALKDTELATKTITVKYKGYQAVGTVKGTALVWGAPEKVEAGAGA